MPSVMSEEKPTERPSAEVEGKVGAEAVGVQEADRVVLTASVVGGAELPKVVLIAPWGVVASSNGEFVLDEESAALVLAAFETHGTDIPVDYEHQSLGGVYASPTGQAPAAGWIKALRAVSPAQCADGDAGLFAEVEWTDAARERLAAREYRYLSPVVLVRQSDRRVVALHSVALTNKPAIIGAKPIVNAELPPAPLSAEKGGSETPADLRDTRLGVEMSEVREAVALLRNRLDLDGSCSVEVVLRAAEQQLTCLMAESCHRHARELVEQAMRAGKLTTAQRDWAMAWAMKDADGFEEWVCSAPTMVVLGRIEPAHRSTPRSHETQAANARRQFQSEPMLAQLTTEQAWVRQALREQMTSSQD